MAYTYITKVTLTSSTVPVTITNIPNTYDSLLVAWSAKGSLNAWITNNQVYFNNNTSANYQIQLFGQNNNTTFLAQGTNFQNVDYTYSPASAANANIFGNSYLYIYNYKSSNNKIFLQNSANSVNSASQGITSITTGTFNSSAEVSRLDFTFDGGNGLANSNFYVYGIN